MLATPHSQSVSPDVSAPVSLAPNPARITTTAWWPQADLSVSDWARQGRWLGALGRASGWWIGDWLRYGNARYGDRYGRAAQVTGYDEHSLRNMAYVAGRFDVPRRREALSFSHHAELASLSPEEQELWLDRAEASVLSVRSLRSELREARRRAAARARRRREEVSAATPTNVSDPSAAMEGTVIADRASARRDGQHRGPGRVNATATKGSGAQLVVCPACGCHFTPSVHRGVAHPRELPSSSVAPRLRMAAHRR
jgi:hypothetical protein